MDRPELVKVGFLMKVMESLLSYLGIFIYPMHKGASNIIFCFK